MPTIGTAYVRIAPNMTGIQGAISKGLGPAGAQAGAQAGTKFGNSFSRLAADPIVGFGEKILKGTLIAGSVAAAALIAKNIGNAIGRIDTLVAFPRVLQAMGVTADGAQAATSRLSKELLGLPTPLQEGAQGVQQLIASGLSADKAVDTFLAMNNALLAAGGNAQDTGIVMESLTRALSGGTTQATTIQAALSRMPTALQGLQKQTGLTAGELYKLYAANPQQLADDLVKLNKEGGGGLASLETQARSATGGIGTAFANMNTAITRGLEGMIRQIGGGELEAGQKKISDAITKVGTAFGNTLVKAGAFIAFMIRNKDVFGPIIVAVGTFIGLIAALAGVIKVITTVQKIWNLVLLANPIALVIVAVAALVAGLVYFFAKTKTGQAIIQTFGRVVSDVFNRVRSVVAAVLGFITSAVRYNFTLAYNIVTGVWGGIGGFFSGVFSKIRNAFSGIASVGKNIVQGLWNGISGMGGWLRDKIISFVKDKIPGPIKKALGISSPSKVAAMLGKQVPAGLAVGIEKASGLVERAATKMANSALTGLTGPSMNANFATSMSGSAASGQVATAAAPAIVQNNNVYNQVDLDSVTRELAWQVRR